MTLDVSFLNASVSFSNISIALNLLEHTETIQVAHGIRKVSDFQDFFDVFLRLVWLNLTLTLNVHCT